MKFKVLGIVDIICEGCGAYTRCVDGKVYDTNTSLMCNCEQAVVNVELTKVEPLTAANIDEVLSGLYNGAGLSDFDANAQLLYANHIIGEYEQNKEEGVVQDADDIAAYENCLNIVVPKPEAEPDADEVDLTTLKKDELKAICAEFVPPIVVPKKATNDAIITLILEHQEG